MILGLQIITIIFALIMIYFALLHYYRKELNAIELLSWTTIWFVTVLVILFPSMLQTFALTFAISRIFDLMVVGGFILIIPLIYLAYIRTKRIEKKLEDLVRELALKELKKPK